MYQLVLPVTCRSAVLHLTHTIPLAGHLGRDKTAQRILRRFYWPTMYRDMAEYCRSCGECQKVGHQRVQRALLIPLPIVGEPFERMAMDIVGPLPRSRAGYKYILVTCDYATCYPDAIPHRSIDAEHVAHDLIKLLSCWHPEGDINGSGEQLHLPVACRDIPTTPHPPHSNHSLPPGLK